MGGMIETEQVARCQYCGWPVIGHPTECISITALSFDQSQNHLSRVDEAAGLLLAAILKHRSVQNAQATTFGPEFTTLMDLRRKM